MSIRYWVDYYIVKVYKDCGTRIKHYPQFGFIIAPLGPLDTYNDYYRKMSAVFTIVDGHGKITGTILQHRIVESPSDFKLEQEGAYVVITRKIEGGMSVPLSDLEKQGVLFYQEKSNDSSDSDDYSGSDDSGSD